MTPNDEQVWFWRCVRSLLGWPRPITTSHVNLILNQREYCEAQGTPLKAFGIWRAKFMAEPQPPVRKLVRRRSMTST